MPNSGEHGIVFVTVRSLSSSAGKASGTLPGKPEVSSITSLMHHWNSGGSVSNEDRLETVVDPIDVFRAQWGTYQKVIRENYMFHREISAAYRTMIDTLPGPLKVLDLGCGDACQICDILPPGRVTEYSGCDLSRQALDIARKNLAPFGNRVRLLCDDMLAVLKAAPDNHFDVACSSYALHHLSFEQKKTFFIECRRTLRDKGVFILADIMREEDETPADYYDRYIGRMVTEWVTLTESEQSSVQEHIRSCDYPESPSVLQSMAHEADFHRCQQLEKRTWHQAWCYGCVDG